MDEIVVKANEDIIARILKADAVGEEYFCIEPDGTLLVDLPIATEKVGRINLLNSDTHIGSMYYADSEEEEVLRMKDSKYKDAWILLEQYLIKGMEVPGEILQTLYELVEMYYSDKESKQ